MFRLGEAWADAEGRCPVDMFVSLTNMGMKEHVERRGHGFAEATLKIDPTFQGLETLTAAVKATVKDENPVVGDTLSRVDKK